MFAFFLSSGLFLGWSLGANDASNVFGTAVGSRMIRFKTAAICCSIFIILGAVLSGAGASHTLSKLGSVNAVAGAFIVAFAAALSVYLMTRLRFPVSTSQAIVGAIIGWNIFSGSVTDTNSLAKIVLTWVACPALAAVFAVTKIVLTWVACPALAAVFAVILYKIVVFIIHHFNIHMFRLDSMTRWGLLLVGAFGSYSLGANNIANVMGVFIPVSPFTDISIFGVFDLSPAQQLFFLGGLAIAVGVLTYSRRVMETVGEGIMKLSIPLVPVSSSQAIVGAVIGIGLLKGGRGIRWRTLGGIASGWVITPIIAGVFSLFLLFFLQNIFHQ
jgi:PiT family inorganic phosphate transporter